MRLLSPAATDAEILDVCREWVDLVAQARFADAIEILHVPARYDASQRWTPSSLERYVANYGSWDPPSDGHAWKVTPIATARMAADRPVHSPTPEVYRNDDDPRSGSVDLDLPLDGEWSDLTAQFEFEPVEGGTGLALYDVRVL
jgi:hypothetical protein